MSKCYILSDIFLVKTLSLRDHKFYLPIQTKGEVDKSRKNTTAQKHFNYNFAIHRNEKDKK